LKHLLPFIFLSRIAKYWQSILVIIFLLIIILQYPLLFIAPFPSGIYATGLFISSIEQLSVFSIFMILLKGPEITCLNSAHKKIFIFFLTLFFLIVVLQFLLWNKQNFREFTFAILWISIPLAVYLYFDIFKKYLVPYFAVLWFFSMIHTVWQLIEGSQCVGISANRNWNGAFLIAATPLALYWLYFFLIKRGISQKKIQILLLFLLSLSLYSLFKAESRGANLALIITGLLYVGLELNCNKNTKKRKYGRLYIYLISVCFILLITICFTFFSQKIAATISHDVRIPLWQGAVNMFLDHPVIGVGANEYEAQYAYYSPVARFLRSHYFAARATHPHNQFLFFASAYGIIGLIAISYLWFAPIVIFLQRYAQATLMKKLIFFSFTMLVMHSMLDLIAMRWPTMQMLLILQGILWAFTMEKHESYTEDTLSKKVRNNRQTVLYPAIVKYLSYMLAIVCLFFCFYLCISNLKTSYYTRNANIALNSKRYLLAIDENQKAIKSGNSALNLFNASMNSLFWLQDYRLAYKFFIQLERIPSKIVAHANSRTSYCLIKMNRLKEALIYQNKEIKVFPLSSLAVYNKYLLEKQLGNNKAAKRTLKHLDNLMQFKGLHLNDIKKIVADPGLDDHYEKLK